jgi:peptidoglycan/LPS O-acetylase OafA/YrhL
MVLRDNRIDIIKGLAIISVTILHTLSTKNLTSIYTTFLLKQTIPLFMLVSGYVFTLSYKDRGIADLKNCYNLNIFKKRIKRLYFPFLVIFLLELLLSKVFLSKSLNATFVIGNLILGGFGPGSYYPVIMFQFLFIIPIIYIISYKKLNYSIPFFLIVGVFFEYFTNSVGLDENIYRLLIGRYIFAIALGSYLALNQNKMNKILLYIGSILSMIYIYASIYLNFHILGHIDWLPQQAPAYFYTALLFIIGMNFLQKRTGFIFTTLAELGKASWHIFLIQMLFFWAIFHGAILHMFGLQHDSSYLIIINVMACLILGYIFYTIETIIHSKKVLYQQGQNI